LDGNKVEELVKSRLNEQKEKYQKKVSDLHNVITQIKERTKSQLTTKQKEM
jgi:hypothetical protein